ncbi:MAG TPA: hypothetical protein EYG03_29650 [Planctomycetes bacterium]|nr:hypothetical protein [Fuerstiella sp.]HIK96130.1 hypothetical protein [Planctomycetota bacterium]
MKWTRPKKRRPAASDPQHANGRTLPIVPVCIALLLAAFAAWSFFAERNPSAVEPLSETGLPDTNSNSMNPTDRVSQLVHQRNRLDETVWRDEVLAQRYEDYFVELWDSLRSARDQIEVLADQSFERIRWGAPQEVSRHDWQIVVTGCDGHEQQMDSVQFAQLLHRFANEGFRIVQTEWHHSRFATDAPGEA